MILDQGRWGLVEAGRAASDAKLESISRAQQQEVRFNMFSPIPCEAENGT